MKILRKIKLLEQTIERKIIQYILKQIEFPGPKETQLTLRKRSNNLHI